MSPLEANKGLLRQPDPVHWQQTGGYPPGSDEYRQFRAEELGLPDNSTWGGNRRISKSTGYDRYCKILNNPKTRQIY